MKIKANLITISCFYSTEKILGINYIHDNRIN